MSKKKIQHRIGSEEFEKFTQDFKQESDRAAVILGAAQLDLLLYQLLEGFMLPNPSGKDELLEGDSPLATFSSRINACYRLGLIDAEFARALHLIRKIRNSFAHEVSSVSLNSGAHKDRIRELVAPFVDNWALATMIESYFANEQTSSVQFRAVIALISLRLEGAISDIRRVRSSTIATLYPPDVPKEKTPADIDKK